jgi:hypothetical protein
VQGDRWPPAADVLTRLVSGAEVATDESHAMLSSGLTSVSHTTTVAPASTSQSGVKVRIRVRARFSNRARIRNSVGDSSAMRDPRSSASPVVIETPPPPSRRHIPQHPLGSGGPS